MPNLRAIGMDLLAGAADTVNASAAAYMPSELASALRRLDVHIRFLVEAYRQELSARAQDPFRGLYISEADIDALLDRTATGTLVTDTLVPGPGTSAPRFARLAQLFELEEFEQEVVLVCLAPELDLRYERLYAYLQDDITRKRPPVDLLLRLLTRPGGALSDVREALGPSGRLARRGLVVFPDDMALPLLSRPMCLDPRVVEYLTGSDMLDARLRTTTALLPGNMEAADHLEAHADLTRVLAETTRSNLPGPLVYLQGPVGANKSGIARMACRAAGLCLLLVDAATLLRSQRPELLLSCAAREALLQGAVLGINGADQLLCDQPDAVATLDTLYAELLVRRGPTLLLGEQRWEPAVWCTAVPGFTIELATAEPLARARVWQRHLDGQVSSAVAADLAERYRLDEAGVQAVAAAARGYSLWRGALAVEAVDVLAASRAVASPPLDGLAVRIVPRYEWGDIVLTGDAAAQLREFCARAQHRALVLGRWGYGRKLARRAGLTALFVGPPGTGKTMSAEIIAGALGLGLYRIDLSAIVSKYIGETEKNLERIFQAADRGDAVLLFDEADALFGKRSEVRDAHDRYANVEVAYLLQRLEVYEGVAILTTNLRGNIDEAFLRRLDCVLEFPMPEPRERLQIWQRSLPPEAPVDEDVDLAFLARKFKLAGGHIRNIALTAAFLAASDGSSISMKHIVRATRREYQKVGKLAVVSEFEQYFDLLSEMDGPEPEGATHVQR